jgi:AraC-like DNA-binding protein
MIDTIVSTAQGLLVGINIEKISFGQGEFDRVIRWCKDVDKIEVLNSDGSMISIKGSGSLWHLHEEVELTFIIEGEGSRLVGDRVDRFSAPCLVLVGPNLPHYWRFKGPSAGICIQISLARLEHALPNLPSREIHRFAKQASKGLIFASKTRSSIEQIILHIATTKGIVRWGALLQLIGHLGEIKMAETQEISSQPFNIDDLAPGYRSIQKSILFILNHFQNHISLEQVLSIAGMSKATFSRHFLRYTGKTFTRFIIDVRIDHAGHRLLSSSDPVSEIAYESGFNNLAHFNRMFLRNNGKTPSTFRDGSSSGKAI